MLRQKYCIGSDNVEVEGKTKEQMKCESYRGQTTNRNARQKYKTEEGWVKRI